jgi:hypothetical protein
MDLLPRSDAGRRRSSPSSAPVVGVRGRGGGFVDDLPIKGLGAGGGGLWGGATLPLVRPWWRGSSVALRWLRCALLP